MKPILFILILLLSGCGTHNFSEDRNQQLLGEFRQSPEGFELLALARLHQEKINNGVLTTAESDYILTKEIIELVQRFHQRRNKRLAGPQTDFGRAGVRAAKNLQRRSQSQANLLRQYLILQQMNRQHVQQPTLLPQNRRMICHPSPGLPNQMICQ